MEKIKSTEEKIKKMLASGEIYGWCENEIINWTIEKPEPKPIGRVFICIESCRKYKIGDITTFPYVPINGWKPVAINEKGEVFEAAE